MLSLEESMTVNKAAQIMNYRDWARDIPYLHFKSDWLVKIVPPFGGAVARFAVHNPLNENYISVYFDAYEELGCVNEPYWEVYDGEECSRFMFGEEDEMMDYIRKVMDR